MAASSTRRCSTPSGGRGCRGGGRCIVRMDTGLTSSPGYSSSASQVLSPSFDLSPWGGGARRAALDRSYLSPTVDGPFCCESNVGLRLRRRVFPVWKANEGRAWCQGGGEAPRVAQAISFGLEQGQERGREPGMCRLKLSPPNQCRLQYR